MYDVGRPKDLVPLRVECLTCRSAKNRLTFADNGFFVLVTTDQKVRNGAFQTVKLVSQLEICTSDKFTVPSTHVVRWGPCQ